MQVFFAKLQIFIIFSLLFYLKLRFFTLSPNGKAFVQGGLDSTIAPQSTKPNKKYQSSFLAP
jgi:hypothetical protein